ncbi:MAG: thioredoxin family protein [Burkholderiales bacterium]|nr:thioredoxin family protein [Burkholderiales bacterium]
MRFLLPLLALLATLSAPAQVLKTPQTTTELLAHAPEGVAPGKPLWLGLSIRHAPKWHTYWRNPGDSGLPTQLNWTLPEGAQAGGIHWPGPHKLPFGPLMNYGYEGDLLLPVRVELPAKLPPGPLAVKLSANWLVCEEQCIPEQGEYALRLPQGQAVNAHAARFEAALAQEPRPLSAQVAARVDGQHLVLQVSGLPAEWKARQNQPVQYFAQDAGVIDHAQAEQAQWQGDTLQLRVALSPQRSESPAQLGAVLRQGEHTGSLQFALAGGWNPTAGTAAPAGAANPTASDTSGGSTSLLLSLLFAFVGGLLLNLMPCVFPVLSLKALGLVNEAPHERHVGAAAYTVGVVLSFLLLAGLLLLLRAGGDQIGWGFQLQQPWVVAALAALFTVIALNLFGVFEFGTWAPSSLAGWRASKPWVDQFATGVLTVAVASPCTAPFMGAALGAALTLPTAGALAVFGALGLGLAAPYAAVALVPGLARRLPRPGAWMARLRTLLAFPMLATVLWLVWVLGTQRGLDAATALLALLLAFALAAWAWAQAHQGSTGWRMLAVLSLAAGLWWSWPALNAPAVGPDAANAPTQQTWQAWSPAKQAELLAAGQPVFVDFTASWCITCQFNKRGALADAAVLADFQARGVALLRADWTVRDATITAELRRLGRSGVPVYALHQPGKGEPMLLPEILSAAGVREALATLSPRP